jgi:hypothetical protein
MPIIVSPTKRSGTRYAALRSGLSIFLILR